MQAHYISRRLEQSTAVSRGRAGRCSMSRNGRAESTLSNPQSAYAICKHRRYKSANRAGT